MPRRPKTTETLASLELLSKDTSMPEEIRKAAADKYIALRLKENPAPVKTVTEQTKASAPTIPFSEFVEAFRKIGDEASVKVEPKPEPKPEIKTEVKQIPPEPVERQQGSMWRVNGQDYIYLSYDPVAKLHLLSEARPTGIGLPEVHRFTEERLTNKRYAQGPRARGYELPEEVKARRQREMQRDRLEWQALGGRSGGDPDEGLGGW